MVVNFEFLSMEPMNNVITCLHYKVDKVVFFGYEQMVREMREITGDFLISHCGVSETEFIVLPEGDFSKIRDGIRAAMNQENVQGNELYFDITGGDSLILVAFGQISREYGTSMHLFDVVKDQLIEFNEQSPHLMSRDVEKKEKKLNLDLMIEMRGGKINYRLQKRIKQENDPEFRKDSDAMFDVAKAEWEVWNPFSEFLRTKLTTDHNLNVFCKTDRLKKELASFSSKLNRISQFDEIVDALAERGILLDVLRNEAIYRFRFKSRAIKDCIWESGSILEMNVYGREKLISDDCRVGVHLDWGYGMHEGSWEDVLNEIDVLTLKGNIMTFISCKTGRMDSHQTLHALYELDTVSKRFGGDYSRKVLVSAQPLNSSNLARAAEMGIEIRSE